MTSLPALALLAATFTCPMERVSTMDSAFAQSVYDSKAVQLVYETPLDIDYEARPYRLTAGACELPTVSADRLVYVFRLRSPELVAEDMVRSLLRLRDPELVTPNAWILKSVDTVRALDGRTVEIRLRQPNHVFPWLMAMSPAAIRRADGSGTGEYELVDWRKHHAMTFRRRTPAEGGFDTVRYLVVDDVTTQWLMFLKGEIDTLGSISKDNWNAVIGANGELDPQLKAAGVSLHTIPSLDVFYLGVNMRDKVLGGNRPLRQALNAAFDYPRWDEYFAHRTVRADGPVPPGVAGRLETPFPYAFDLEKARSLMAAAGYPGGIDPATGRRLVLTLAIGRASQSSREMGELLAAFYERIGVKLELNFFTWDAFLKAVNEGRVQLFNMGWVGDYPDAENFLQLFHSCNLSPGPNHAGYVNAEFDREYDAAMASAGEDERNGHWRRCQEIIREDCPWVFTHVGCASVLVNRRVGNYVPSDFPYGNERYYRVQEDVGR